MDTVPTGRGLSPSFAVSPILLLKWCSFYIQKTTTKIFHFLLKDVFHLQRYDLYVVISARDVFSSFSYPFPNIIKG